jgi:four helix bundle protein
MGIVEEEADESLYWMELLIESSLLPQERLSDLMKEGNELTAIVVASIRTARQRKSP